METVYQKYKNIYFEFRQNQFSVQTVALSSNLGFSL